MGSLENINGRMIWLSSPKKTFIPRLYCRYGDTQLVEHLIKIDKGVKNDVDDVCWIVNGKNVDDFEHCLCRKSKEELIELKRHLRLVLCVPCHSDGVIIRQDDGSVNCYWLLYLIKTRVLFDDTTEDNE